MLDKQHGAGKWLSSPLRSNVLSQHQWSDVILHAVSALSESGICVLSETWHVVTFHVCVNHACNESDRLDEERDDSHLSI